MLDIYEMEVFLAAAETGSFSEAGRRLQLSQPAISMQIRSLEKHLGVDLFHRAGRHIHLTEIGTALVPLARDLVNHAAQVHEAVAALHGEVIGVLKIACSTTAGHSRLPRLIARFIEKYPAVQVVGQLVRREMALQMVTTGEAQIGISSLYEPSKDLDYRPFIADPIVLIVPPNHKWARQSLITLDELPHSSFVRHELNAGTLQIVAAGLAEQGMSINDLPARLILSNSEAIYMAVTEGVGAAFVSRCAAAEGIAAGRVVEVSFRGLALCQQLYLVRHQQAAPGSVQSAFWDFVFSPAARDILNC